MAGVEMLIISLYLYILGRSLSVAGEEARMDREACQEKWKEARKEVGKKTAMYLEKRQVEKRIEKERGLEVAGTLNGGVAAPSTPQEASGMSCEESLRAPAKKGNARNLMSKVTSIFPFIKSKND